jgi:hypothetical protein
MTHYFITWFEYNDHHENTGGMYQVEWMKPEYQNAKGVARIFVLKPQGVILGTSYLSNITKYKRIYESSTSEEGAGSFAGAASAGTCCSWRW